jgi:hypothetical protein
MSPDVENVAVSLFISPRKTAARRTTTEKMAAMKVNCETISLRLIASID